MKTFGMMLAIAMAGIVPAMAEDAAPSQAATSQVPPYVLKNKSAFGVDATARTPFWPIGWKKGEAVQPSAPTVAAKKAFQIQPSHFTVTTVLLSHPPLATINGKAFGEGEILPVIVGNEPVRVVVKAIRDGGVWLDQSGHQIFVPMKREQYIPKTPGATLQPEDFKIKIKGE